MPRTGTPANPKDPQVGDLVAGEFRLLRPIGEGGMGVVYEARNRLGRSVAIKLLRADLIDRDDLIQRFLREGTASAAICHPGIVDVFEAGWSEDGGVPYLAMELLEGRNLAKEIGRCGTMPPTRVRAIASQMLDALSAAHEAGVVHRDLKPGNVFLVPHGIDEAVKLLDLGISKMLDGGTALTEAGQVFGTPAYMAPEQAVSTMEADHRADLYSVGAMMFEMLSGIPPFAGESILFRLQVESPPSLGDVAPEVPADLVALVDRALRRDRTKRWRSAREMRDALNAIELDGEGAAERPIESDVVTVSDQTVLPATVARPPSTVEIEPLHDQHTRLLPPEQAASVATMHTPIPDNDLETDEEAELETHAEDDDEAPRSRVWSWVLAIAVLLLAIVVGFAIAAALSTHIAMLDPPHRVGPETATILSCCVRSLC